MSNTSGQKSVDLPEYIKASNSRQRANQVFARMIEQGYNAGAIKPCKNA
jgi:hypothetical protein